MQALSGIKRYSPVDVFIQHIYALSQRSIIQQGPLYGGDSAGFTRSCRIHTWSVVCKDLGT